MEYTLVVLQNGTFEVRDSVGNVVANDTNLTYVLGRAAQYLNVELVLPLVVLQ